MKFVFLGDIMLGRLFNHKSVNYNPFGAGLLKFLKTADFVVGNLETTITDSDTPVPKTFNYKMVPSHAKWLQKLSPTHLNIANNHIMDYGIEGMKDTREYLNDLNIGFSGAGENIKSASAPKIYISDDYKIGVLGAADHYKDWTATVTRPGINYFDMKSPSSLVTQTRAAAKTVDFLIVSLHWGSNYMDHVPDEMRTLAHKLVDSGADVVHGTSAHHTLPIEVYNDSLIIYSNGDFIDDYAIDSKYRNDLGMLVVLDYDIQSGIIDDIYTVPTIIQDMKVDLLL